MKTLSRSNFERTNNMKIVVVLFLISSLFSCSENTQTKEPAQGEIEYVLIERDSLMFRRAYWGQDTLEGKEWDIFMNRNPEGDYNLTEHSSYKKLVEANLILDENLNIREIDTLPETFEYQISKSKKLKVIRSTVYDPELVDAPGHALRFFDKDKCVYADTIEYGFPPDVTFFTRDLDKDGSHELLAVFRWYIVNGDNFDLFVYNLKEKP